MEHTEIVTSTELENYANTRESEAVIPELICLLVKESVDDRTLCRIPYGDAINQRGWDGLVETQRGFREFVPAGRSYWEIGTGGKPQNKATTDFGKRTKGMPLEDRQEASYVFVTPLGAGSGGWDQPAQSKWIKRRKESGWGKIRILDAIQLSEWLREFPCVGKWLVQSQVL